MTPSESPLPLRYDARQGRLSLGEQPYLLIRPQTLAPLLLSDDPVVLRLLDAGGREGGRLAAESTLGRGLRGREALETLLEMGGAIGWGRMALLEWSEQVIRVEVRHSPFAEAARSAQKPVCHLLRGVLAGMIAAIAGRPAECRETACEAGGDAACRFETTL